MQKVQDLENEGLFTVNDLDGTALNLSTDWQSRLVQHCHTTQDARST